MTKTQKVRELLKNNAFLQGPCAYDPISALVIEKAGFELISTSGFCMAGAMLGAPDIGLVMFNEMMDSFQRMADATTVPILVDGESGFGNAMGVRREVRALEHAGVAGMFLDDESYPPNCPMVKPEVCISAQEMVGKIQAALDARTDPNFLIMARTDVNDYHEAIDRANMYYEAGADVVKIIMNDTEEHLRSYPKLVSGPLHQGVTHGRGSACKFSAQELGEMGYKIISFIQPALMLSLKNMMAGMEKLRRTGRISDLFDDSLSIDEYFQLIDLPKWLDEEKRFVIRD